MCHYGDLSKVSTLSHGLQIVSIANLFGVKARPSANAERFHQKFRLTQLERSPNAGILTRHGDMLVCLTSSASVSSLPAFCPMLVPLVSAGDRKVRRG